jgi:hypothetical protein
VLRELGRTWPPCPRSPTGQAYAGTAAPINFNGLVRQYYLRAGGEVGDLQVNLVDKAHATTEPRDRDPRAARAAGDRPRATAPTSRWSRCRPGPPVLSPIVAEVYGPEAEGRRQVAKAVRAVFERHDRRRRRRQQHRRRAAQAAAGRPPQGRDARRAAAGDRHHAARRPGRRGDAAYLHDGSKYPAPARLQLPRRAPRRPRRAAAAAVRAADGRLVPIRELVTVSDTLREQPVYHKDLLPVNYVVADMAGALDSPLYGMFAMRSEIARGVATPGGGTLREYFIRQPDDPYRGYALKWDGEWQITYETFRDMGAAYAVGLVLIYLLVVAQFGSYLTPLIIMAPIPLTIIGVMPGHALLGAQFTATSMIGMIALAGIIVRNSILLVDFINCRWREGMPFKRRGRAAAITRAQPIVLTGLAAMLGAFFILDDPIFNGLAISLIFGIWSCPPCSRWS